MLKKTKKYKKEVPEPLFSCVIRKEELYDEYYGLDIEIYEDKEPRRLLNNIHISSDLYELSFSTTKECGHHIEHFKFVLDNDDQRAKNE